MSSVKDDAIRNLMDFRVVMGNLDIPFCLMDGTALGAYREKDFVGGDEDDIDVGVRHSIYDVMLANFDNLLSIGFTTGNNMDVAGRREGTKLYRGKNHVDILRMHIVGKGAYNLGRTSSRAFGLPPVFPYEFPSECFLEFDTINFHGKGFNVPHDMEKFLSVRYTDWKTPQPRGVYNYLNKEHCPCISYASTWPEHYCPVCDYEGLFKDRVCPNCNAVANKRFCYKVGKRMEKYPQIKEFSYLHFVDWMDTDIGGEELEVKI